MKSDMFKDELRYIKDERLRKALSILINYVPDYFFKVAASSTGKYHPDYALGEGGLLRHTKAAARFGFELLENPMIGGKYTSLQKDLMLMAIILHDTAKLGDGSSKYTLFNHPLLVGPFIKEHQEEAGLKDEEVAFLDKVISSHMGYWNTSDYSDVTLPRPETKEQNFVHMCDYLASRKVFKIDFDENNNIK